MTEAELHRSLNIDEIVGLLETARAEQAKQPSLSDEDERYAICGRLALIQIRLNGETNDASIDSDAYKAGGEIDRLYVAFLRGSGQDIHELARLIYLLMRVK